MKHFLLFTLCLGLLFQHTFGAVGLSFPFVNNMVLQREMKTPVRGTALSGEVVTVTFNGQTHSATADSNGKWVVYLNPMIAGGPYSLVAKSANNTVTVSNVLVGDVWICGGQSNMFLLVKHFVVVNGTDISGPGGLPKLYSIDSLLVGNGKLRLAKGMGDIGGADVWKMPDKAAISEYSAVGFFFGRYLSQQIKVPLGLITVARSASGVEQWMDPVTVAGIPGLKWGTAYTGHGVVGDLWPKFAEEIGFGIKGMIWYQGEENTSTWQTYRTHLQAFITGMRRVWNQGNFPFYIMQLAGYQFPQTQIGKIDDSWCSVREAHRLMLCLPNTGVATAMDIGDSEIHARNKADVGRRFSYLARALTYGELDLVYTGPMYHSMKVISDTFRLKFTNIGTGLKSITGENLKGFAVFDKDKKMAWGSARIEGDEVVVHSPGFLNPVGVAYAWHGYPIISLYNKEGLPALPFKTSGDQIPLNRYGCRLNGNLDSVITIHDPNACITASRFVPDVKTTTNNDFFQILGNRIIINNQGAYTLEIFDLRGKRLVKHSGVQNVELKLGNIQKGLYIVKLKTGKEQKRATMVF